MRFVISITLSVCAASLSPVQAEQPVQMSVFTGFEVDSGDYGLEDNTVVKSAPIGVRLNASRLSLYATTSYLWSEGPAGAVSRSGFSGGAWRNLLANRFPNVEESFSADGWGDTIIGAEARLTPQGPTYVAAAISVTLPTGDEVQGLGTGRTDWAFTLLGERRISDSIALTATAGYVLAGENDETLALLPAARDYAYGNFGVRKEFSRGVALSANIALSQSAYDGLDGGGEASLMLSTPHGERIRLGVYGVAGFTDASPDIGAGVSLSFNNILGQHR